MKKHYPKIAYKNLLFRIVAAIAVSNFLMFYNDKRTFWSSIRTWIYYESLVENFIMAFILICFVHVITKKLDRYFDWRKDTVYRIILQTVFGFFFTVAFAVALAMIFFSVNGMDIYKTDYFPLALPIIKIMIILLNIYYFLMYIYVEDYRPENSYIPNFPEPVRTYGSIKYVDNAVKIGKQQFPAMQGEEIKHEEPEVSATMEETELKTGEQPDTDRPGSYILVSLNSSHLRINVSEQVCFFYRDNSITKVYNITGDKYPVSHTISYYDEIYGGKQFFLINRSTLININMIKGYKSSANRTIILLLDLPFQMDLDSEILTISRDRIKDFKAWMLK